MSSSDRKDLINQLMILYASITNDIANLLKLLVVDEHEVPTEKTDEPQS